VKRFFFAGFVAVLLLTPLAVRDQSLARGQVIKQSFSYAQTESLAQNGFDLTRTWYPCSVDGKPQSGEVASAQNGFRLRAEEPPFFYLPAAWLLKFAGAPPWVWPYFSFLLLALATGYLVWGLKGFSSFQKMLIFLATSFIPVFCRYSIQFLPDLQATAFLVEIKKISRPHRAPACREPKNSLRICAPLHTLEFAQEIARLYNRALSCEPHSFFALDPIFKRPSNSKPVCVELDFK
jgi:hypothetical protein